MLIARERRGTYHIVGTFITNALQDTCELEDLRADSWLSRSLVGSGVHTCCVMYGVTIHAVRAMPRDVNESSSQGDDAERELTRTCSTDTFR
jgi:hypothetical protein